MIGSAVAVLSAAIASAPATAQAVAEPVQQDVPPPQETAAPSQPDIIVTGSLIRGAAPVGSPLIAVGRESLTESGTLTVSDALKEVPQITGLGVDESHRGAQGGSSNIFYNNQVNLRSIGPQATLTLVNGHRAPSTGTAGYSIDPSIIPTLAVERLEVVADGASATYGSDAIAGVANIITRNRFDGLEVSARLGGADDYNENQQGLIVGKQWANAGVMLAFEHSYHSRLEGADRPYFRYDQTEFGGRDYRPNQCNPGTILVGGVRYAIPAGGVTPDTADLLVPNTRNTCDVWNTRTILPEQDRISFFGAAHWEPTEGVRIFAEGYYYDRRFNLSAPNTTPAQTITVPSSNPFFVLPPGVDPATESVRIEYYVPGVGPQFVHKGGARSWQAFGGVEVDLLGDFRATVQGAYGKDKSEAEYPQLNSAALTAALSDPDPATALNPFASGIGGNNPATLASIFSNYFYAPGDTEQKFVEAKVDGSLFMLPGGAVRIAVGGTYREESLVAGSIAGPPGGIRTSVTSGARDIKAVYAEVLVPLFGADNATTFFNRLTLNAAIRHEDYSDVGPTTNPKFGIEWSPVAGLSLRGSYGTSFRAPSLGEIYNPNPALNVNNFVDPQSPTGRSDVLGWSDNNPDLKPETAETYSFGFELAPTGLPGLRASGNYFNIDYEGQIARYLNVNTVLQQEAFFAPIIIREYSQEFLDSLVARLPVRNGVLPANPVIIDARYRNLGALKVSGLDGTLSYRFDTGIGQLRAAVAGTYFLNYDVAISPTSGFVSRLDTLDYPQRLNLRGTLGWSLDQLNASVQVAYTSPYDNTSVEPVQRIKGSTVTDLHLGYEFESSGVLKNATIAIDISNLFDVDPPFADLIGGFDPNVASALGRRVLVSLGWKI
ncbi:TonB-dependent receptor domain-containing protein [Sphingomonas gilva]|uniref:TonB-dependent receptor domain-containing protein n=1 Tax=Sphingomonas gilva TaxID=2305907 RepID=UPI001CA3E27A|nr:TonB-dependent receptor [Sphingomonas gilva]